MASIPEDRLKKIIAEQLSVSEDEVTPDASFIAACVWGDLPGAQYDSFAM